MRRICNFSRQGHTTPNKMGAEKKLSSVEKLQICNQPDAAKSQLLVFFSCILTVEASIFWHNPTSKADMIPKALNEASEILQILPWKAPKTHEIWKLAERGTSFGH